MACPTDKQQRIECTDEQCYIRTRCRNNWHNHTGGQILIAVGGAGYYQERGKPAIRMEVGDVIAPGVVHWHGTAPV